MQREYSGTDAKIFFKRIPATVFGTDIMESADLSSLDLKKKYKVTEEDLRSVRNRSVYAVRFITLINDVRKDVSSEIYLTEGEIEFRYMFILLLLFMTIKYNMVTGKLPYLGVQLITAQNVPVTTLPDSPSRKLTVSVDLCDMEGTRIRRMGVCAVPMTETGQTGVAGEGDKYYFFKDIKERPGKYRLAVKALDATRELYTSEIILHVSTIFALN